MAALILYSEGVVAQDFVFDNSLIDVQTRYRNRVSRIRSEQLDNSVLIFASTENGSPQVPGLNKVNYNGATMQGWSYPVAFDDPPYSLVRVSDGYWIGGGPTQRKIGLNGSWANVVETDNGPFESFQSTTGWANEEGMLYVGGTFIDWSTDPPRRTGIVRNHPDGTLDESFPLVPIRKNWTLTASIWRFTEYDEDRLLLSGSFDSIQGHYSPRIAMMFKTGIIDTSFTSPFVPYGDAYPVHIDSHGRMLVSYWYSTQAAPLDTAEVWRLLPDGNLDPAFSPMRLTSDPLWVYGTKGGMSIQKAIQTQSGGYIIGGTFDYANGQPRKCLAEIDSTGAVVSGTFETNQMFIDTILHPWFTINNIPNIWVADMLEAPDGSILLGGQFSGFAGQVSLNLVKIKRDIETGIWQVDAPKGASVYPNPGGAQVHVSTPTGKHAEHIAVYDLSGRLLHTQAVIGQQTFLQTEQWGVGVFIIRITYADGGVESLRAVIIGQ